MESVKELHNILFGRKEIEMSVELDSPPTKAGAAKIVSENFSAQEENVHVKKIDGKFGTHNFVITAEVYPSKSEKERVNSINKRKKKTAKAQ